MMIDDCRDVASCLLPECFPFLAKDLSIGVSDYSWRNRTKFLQRLEDDASFADAFKRIRSIHFLYSTSGGGSVTVDLLAKVLF